MSNYAAINIIDRIKRIKGVGDTMLFGGSDYSMRVWVRPDRLAALGLTVVDLKNAIKAQNTLSPAGQIGGEPSPQGDDVHVHREHEGAAQERRGVRGDHRPLERRRLAGPPEGRRPGRARLAPLQPDGTPQRQAVGDHRRLPGPRVERHRRQGSGREDGGRPRRRPSRRTSPGRSPSTRRRRSRRGSPRSSTRSSRRSSSSSSSSSSSCRTGGRRSSRSSPSRSRSSRRSPSSRSSASRSTSCRSSASSWRSASSSTTRSSSSRRSCTTSSTG